MWSYSVAGYFSISSLFCIGLVLVVFIAAAATTTTTTTTVFRKGSYYIVLPRIYYVNLAGFQLTDISLHLPLSSGIICLAYCWFYILLCFQRRWEDTLVSFLCKAVGADWAKKLLLSPLEPEFLKFSGILNECRVARCLGIFLCLGTVTGKPLHWCLLSKKKKSSTGQNCWKQWNQRGGEGTGNR